MIRRLVARQRAFFYYALRTLLHCYKPTFCIIMENFLYFSIYYKPQ